MNITNLQISPWLKPLKPDENLNLSSQVHNLITVNWRLSPLSVNQWSDTPYQPTFPVPVNLTYSPHLFPTRVPELRQKRRWASRSACTEDEVEQVQ